MKELFRKILVPEVGILQVIVVDHIWVIPGKLPPLKALPGMNLKALELFC